MGTWIRRRAFNSEPDVNKTKQFQTLFWPSARITSHNILIQQKFDSEEESLCLQRSFNSSSLTENFSRGKKIYLRTFGKRYIVENKVRQDQSSKAPMYPIGLQLHWNSQKYRSTMLKEMRTSSRRILRMWFSMEKWFPRHDFVLDLPSGSGSSTFVVVLFRCTYVGSVFTQSFCARVATRAALRSHGCVLWNVVENTTKSTSSVTTDENFK